MKNSGLHSFVTFGDELHFELRIAGAEGIVVLHDVWLSVKTLDLNQTSLDHFAMKYKV